MEGLDLAHSTRLGSGILRAKVSGGATRNDFVVAPNEPAVELDISPIVATTLGWENDTWRMQLGYAHLHVATSSAALQPLMEALQMSEPYWPQAQQIAADLESNGRTMRFYSAGIAFDDHPWRLQAEASFIESDYKVFPSMYSGYASVGYRIGNVTLYGLGALARNTTKRIQIDSAPAVPALQGLQAVVQGQFDLDHIDQHTFSLGARWDMRHNFALKVQWDRTWVKPYGGGLLMQRASLTSGDQIDTLSINLDFVF